MISKPIILVLQFLCVLVERSRSDVENLVALGVVVRFAVQVVPAHAQRVHADVESLSVEEQRLLRKLKPDPDDVPEFEQALDQVWLRCDQLNQVAELVGPCAADR